VTFSFDYLIYLNAKGRLIMKAILAVSKGRKSGGTNKGFSFRNGTLSELKH